MRLCDLLDLPPWLPRRLEQPLCRKQPLQIGKTGSSHRACLRFPASAKNCSPETTAPSKQEEECGPLWRLLDGGQQVHTASLQLTATSNSTTATTQQHEASALCSWWADRCEGVVAAVHSEMTPGVMVLVCLSTVHQCSNTLAPRLGRSYAGPFVKPRACSQHPCLLVSCSACQGGATAHEQDPVCTAARPPWWRRSSC